MKKYTVTALWDEEAKVWVAESEDIPGLATYGKTMEHLIEKLNAMIPELLELNGGGASMDIPYQVMMDQCAHRPHHA